MHIKKIKLHQAKNTCVSYHMPKKIGSVGRDFFRRAVGIYSNWRMIITHVVMLYIDHKKDCII